MPVVSNDPRTGYFMKDEGHGINQQAGNRLIHARTDQTAIYVK